MRVDGSRAEVRVIYPGHCYALQNLKDFGEQELQFRQDPPLHPEVHGTSCQEVLRALVDRVEVLDREVPWVGNAEIVHHLRMALAGFEARALYRKVEKGALKIERLPVGRDGHVILKEEDE